MLAKARHIEAKIRISPTLAKQNITINSNPQSQDPNKTQLQNDSHEESSKPQKRRRRDCQGEAS